MKKFAQKEVAALLQQLTEAYVEAIGRHILEVIMGNIALAQATRQPFLETKRWAIDRTLWRYLYQPSQWMSHDVYGKLVEILRTLQAQGYTVETVGLAAGHRWDILVAGRRFSLIYETYNGLIKVGQIKG